MSLILRNSPFTISIIFKNLFNKITSLLWQHLPSANSNIFDRTFVTKCCIPVLLLASPPILQNMFGARIKRRDLFNDCLPPEIATDILSRLPVKSAARCKSVCRPWRNLIDSPYFAALHLGRCDPTTWLVVGKKEKGDKTAYGVFGFQGKRCVSEGVVRGPNPKTPNIDGAAHDLLFSRSVNRTHECFFVCNPITREYVELELPRGRGRDRLDVSGMVGFGASETSGEYKVVRVLPVRGTCQVYTLGTRKWRSIAFGGLEFKDRVDFSCAFVHGNLHWLVHDGAMGNVRVLRFDLETELFTTFSPPPSLNVVAQNEDNWKYSVSDFEGKLCLCDSTGCANCGKIVIWFMNKYGDETSWAKAFVIERPCSYKMPIFPVRVFEDGDALFRTRETAQILRYEKKSRKIEGHCLLQGCSDGLASVVSFTPTFVSLKSFGTLMENVASF